MTSPDHPPPAGVLLDVNPGMIAMLGYASRSDLLAVSARSLYARADDRLRWQQIMQISS